jgi:hypothetical protein
MRRYINVAVVQALAIIAICVFVPKARADGVAQGKVEWTASNVIVFKDYSGPVIQIQVDLNARITLNGRPIRLIDLKPGTHVTIYYEDGPFAPVAVAIEAFGRFGSPGVPETVSGEPAG